MDSSQKTPGPHSRLAVNIPVQISFTDIDRGTISAEGIAINLSRSGACLLIGFELPVGTIVAIHWEDEHGSHKARTSLRWKQERDGQWQSGVEALDHPYLWTRLLTFICQTNNIELACVP